MNRLWWGLLGVAAVASSTGCRHTCGDTKCHLFSRENCAAPTCLTSASKDACGVPTQLGYPSAGPVYGPLPSGAVPSAPSGVETIPPTFVPAVPTPAIPPGSVKNILPPPLELSPPTSVVGLPK